MENRRQWRKHLSSILFLVPFVVVNSVSASVLAADSAWTDLIGEKRTALAFGIGRGTAQVRDSNSKRQLDSYNNESGFSINLRLASELPVGRYTSFQAGADVFSSASASSLFAATASYATALTAGVVLGKVTESRIPYLSLGFGVGAVYLSDQGPDTNCIICTGDKGGWAGGLASRIAVGYTLDLLQPIKHRGRLELVWMRVGGDGHNSDFPDEVDAFLETVLVVLSLSS